MKSYRVMKVRSSGFTLIEMIIYVAVLTIVLLAGVTILFSESSSWRHAKALRDVTNGSRSLLDRMIYEIRLASAVDTNLSILNTSPGKLVLNTFEDEESQNVVSLEMYLENGALKVKKGNNPIQILSGESPRVTELVFNHLTSEKVELVRVHLTLEAGQSKERNERSFTTAALLRSSY